MAPPIKSAANPTQSRGFGPPSNNLWIGNVSPDVSESELRSLFEKYGKVDSATTYPPRNYAFVYFKDVESAISAKQGLQGLVLRGNPLKIEFAKPAKPCKSLWVAGIGQSVSKEELEKEFLRFGKVQEFRFLRDRNTAYVDYIELEDATQALKSMNGRRIGGAQIRVDYLRSQSSRREQGPDAKEGHFPGRNMGPSDFRWMGQDSLGNYPEPTLAGSKRKNFLSPGSQYGEEMPTNVLFISHPPSVIIEEDMLHNAMILFGEIERIKTFSDRNHAFVEFRSVEEARRAKEGLQGKLFNDPRISIEYSSTEFPGSRGQAGEYPFQPVQRDILGLTHPVLPGNNPVHLGNHGPDLYMRPPLGPHSAYEPALHGPEFNDLAAVHKLHTPNPQTLMGGPNWRRSSPTSGVVSSPSAGFNALNKPASGAWDVFDANQLQRESKRSRFDANLATENIGGLDEHYGASGSLTRGTTSGLGQRHPERDCIWRGLIAKGGTPVCRARCVPIGDGLGVDIPDVVNCSARTGLDLLSQHYEEAIGFSSVFFLPDSEEDFASYTEFLRYLGSKDRAGVAKFDDGTTLFLVPPSDFLTNVLKVSGPERLYGVVLNFPPVIPASSAINPPPIHHRYTDHRKIPTFQTGYGAIPPDERVSPLGNSRVLPMDNSRVSPLGNSRVLPDDSKFPPKIPPVTSSFPALSVPPASATSQPNIALTPELIATLTSLLPVSNSQTASLSQMSSNDVAQWKPEHQPLDHNGLTQLQHHLYSQANPTVSNPSGHFHPSLNPYSQMHDRSMNLAPSSQPTATPLQTGPASVVPDVSQHYQQGSSQGMDNRTDAMRFYNSSVVQQPAYPGALPNQIHVSGASQPQPYMPQPAEVEPTHQSQSLQTAPLGVNQESNETEADKNERYKTTLLFAANLLSRIHQPPDNQPGQGAGGH